MDYAEGRALIEELNQMITPQARVYAHRWAPRECMVWDNRCTLHRATGFDEGAPEACHAALHDRRRQAFLRPLPARPDDIKSTQLPLKK